MTQQQRGHASPGSPGKHSGGGIGGLSHSTSLPNLMAVSVKRGHNIGGGVGNSNINPSDPSPSSISPLSPNNSPAEQTSDRGRRVTRRTGTESSVVGNREGIRRSQNRRGTRNDDGNAGRSDEDDDDENENDGEDTRKDKRGAYARRGGSSPRGGVGGSSSSLKKGSRSSQSCESLLDEMEEMDRHSDPDEEGQLITHTLTLHLDAACSPFCNFFDCKKKF